MSVPIMFRPGDIVRLTERGKTTFMIERIQRPGYADLVPAPGRADASPVRRYQVDFASLVLIETQS